MSERRPRLEAEGGAKRGQAAPGGRRTDGRAGVSLCGGCPQRRGNSHFSQRLRAGWLRKVQAVQLHWAPSSSSCSDAAFAAQLPTSAMEVRRHSFMEHMASAGVALTGARPGRPHPPSTLEHQLLHPCSSLLLQAPPPPPPLPIRRRVKTDDKLHRRDILQHSQTGSA